MSNAAFKRLLGPVSLNDITPAVYTVPAGFKAVAHAALLAGHGGNSAHLILSIGADAVGTRVLDEIHVAGSGLRGLFSLGLPLSAAETLEALCAVGENATLTVVGEEIPV